MLSKKGICYLILVQENKPDEIDHLLSSQYGLQTKVNNRTSKL